MDIFDAKLWLLEHFEKSVKLLKSTNYQPIRRNRPNIARKTWGGGRQFLVFKVL